MTDLAAKFNNRTTSSVNQSQHRHLILLIRVIRGQISYVSASPQITPASTITQLHPLPCILLPQHIQPRRNLLLRSQHHPITVPHRRLRPQPHLRNRCNMHTGPTPRLRIVSFPMRTKVPRLRPRGTEHDHSPSFRIKTPRHPRPRTNATSLNGIPSPRTPSQMLPFVFPVE